MSEGGKNMKKKYKVTFEIEAGEEFSLPVFMITLARNAMIARNHGLERAVIDNSLGQKLVVTNE